jgi:hypothetical protein
MATITPIAASSNTALSYQSATASDSLIATAQRVTLMVVNGSGSTVTLTFAGSIPCSYGSTHNVTQTVAAGATVPIQIVGAGASPAMTGTVSATGTVTITYSSTTSVTVAAVTE